MTVSKRMKTITYTLQGNYMGNGWDDAPYQCETLEIARNIVKAIEGDGFKFRIIKQTREVVK
jgi:hypothetical protein